MPDVVIIGAGPYGLSIAANLRLRQVPLRIFGRPMEMWTDQMPKGMVLKSDGFATNFGNLPLTLAKFCKQTGRAYGDVGHRTPLNDLLAYAQAIQDEYVGTVEDERVVSLDQHRDGFLVSLLNGEEVWTKRVITATGLMGFQRLPTIPGLLSDRLSHASAHNDLTKFSGQAVVVIGGGQSAFEIAALLHEQGAAKVTVLSRREPFWFDPEGESVPSTWQRIRHPNFGLGPGYRAWLWSEAPALFHRLPIGLRKAKAYSTFGPAGSGWLRYRVIDVPGIDCLVGKVVRAADRAGQIELTVKLSPIGSEIARLRADHVIAATGYQPDLRRIEFLRPLLSRNKLQCTLPGVPALNRRFETSISGWHVAGNASAVSFGPSMRFIYGTNWAAPQIASGLGYKRTQVQIKSVLAGQTLYSGKRRLQ